jgi:methyl-accepting chemotaxis protein
MAQDEMVLVALEEIAKQLAELKKTPAKSGSMKLSKIEEQFKLFRDGINYYYKEVQRASVSINFIEKAIKEERTSVTHTYIEIKKPHWWIISIVSYVLISFCLCLFIFQSHQKLKNEAKAYTANDMKYRFIKLRSDRISEISKYAKTTDEWIYFVDDYYNTNQQDIENYVLKKEAALKREFEARELAKQKASEAKEAIKKADELKKKVNEVEEN